MENRKISVYTDGGARGNPGPAALGVYIIDGEGIELAKIGKEIGRATNNIAEYKAILEAFTWLNENKEILGKNAQIYFYMDSLLAYSQIVGLYKIKNASLRNLLFAIREKEASLGFKVYYKHVKREYNKKADALVNLALDSSF